MKPTSLVDPLIGDRSLKVTVDNVDACRIRSSGAEGTILAHSLEEDAIIDMFTTRRCRDVASEEEQVQKY